MTMAGGYGGQGGSNAGGGGGGSGFVALRSPEVTLDNISSLSEAWEISQVLSQSDLVPRSLQGKAANILLMYLNGRELGLSFAQSLRALYSPGPGQIQMRGVLMLAKLRQAGHDYWWEYSDGGDTCTFYIKRADSERTYEASFGVDDAIAAGLAKRNDNGDVVAFSRDSKPLPWMTYRQDMLFWRSGVRCTNRAAPEVTLGFEVIGTEVSQAEEVTLQPAQAGPQAGGEPAVSGEVADGSPAEDHTAELAALDAQGKSGAPDAPGRPAGDGAVTDSAAPSPAPLSPEPLEVRETALAADSHTLREQLTASFTAIGIPPRKYTADVYRACTLLCRRRISRQGQMTDQEMTRLIAALRNIRAKFQPDHYPVAFADWMEAMRQEWERADPDGYASVFPPAPEPE